MAWIKKYWTLDKPENPEKFLGRVVKVRDDNGNTHVVEIEQIMGNITRPTRFEIVSKGVHYTIVMLDFYAQMNNEKVTQEEIMLFDALEYQVNVDGNRKKRRSSFSPVVKRGGLWQQRKH